MYLKIRSIACVVLIGLLSTMNIACGEDNFEEPQDKIEEETQKAEEEEQQDVPKNPDFVMTWKPDQSSRQHRGKENQIWIVIFRSIAYDFSIDWGDGSEIEKISKEAKENGYFVYHQYSESKEYQVTIKGEMPFFRCYSQPTLLSIDNWGSQRWLKTSEMFENCANVRIHAKDAPNLSSVRDMSSMFLGAISFDDPIAHWDVSNVRDMSSMFMSAVSFDQDLSAWDVSSVRKMSKMFASAHSFNQPLNNWNTAEVVSTKEMFKDARNFDQPLNNWNVPRVIDMTGMFAGVSFFNQDLSSWNVANVRSMVEMFKDATSFDQDLSAWQIQSVGSMSDMFAGVRLSVNNYDALLKAWSQELLEQNSLYAERGMTFSAPNSYYCKAESVRERMIASGAWKITDAGKKCP